MLIMISIMYLLSVNPIASSVSFVAIPCCVSTHEKIPAFMMIKKIIPVVLAVLNSVSLIAEKSNSL